jgi:hypothetical protein
MGLPRRLEASFVAFSAAKIAREGALPLARSRGLRARELLPDSNLGRPGDEFTEASVLVKSQAVAEQIRP